MITPKLQFPISLEYYLIGNDDSSECVFNFEDEGQDESGSVTLNASVPEKLEYKNNNWYKAEGGLAKLVPLDNQINGNINEFKTILGYRCQKFFCKI